MRNSAFIMGMPVTVIVAENQVSSADIEAVFDYFRQIDTIFSPFKAQSELERFNRGQIKQANLSSEMKEILKLAEQTKIETNGYFDIRTSRGQLDPSGLVKGWAIGHGTQLLQQKGYRNIYVEIAGDIQLCGRNERGELWRIGIRNPFKTSEIIQTINLTGQGIATSGSYLQGEHIYNPFGGQKPDGVVSLTVIGPNVYEADRFATAAFAMGIKGLELIESLPGFEGYMITDKAQAMPTSGFQRYVRPSRSLQHQ
jgi:thiamine biosynthesis lipoprotein